MNEEDLDILTWKEIQDVSRGEKNQRNIYMFDFICVEENYL